MNLLTELLLAILISALLAVNTVVQTNQTTNETAAVAVGAYLSSVAAAVARYAQANGGVAPTQLSDLSTAGGLGLGSVIPAGNGDPIFGVANLITASTTFSSSIAYACTGAPMSIRQVKTDDQGRDSLVNAAIISMGGSGARTYSANPTALYGAFGKLDLSGKVKTPGNGILCAWKNIYTNDVLREMTTNPTNCTTSNKYQVVFSTSQGKPVYCDGNGNWKGFQ